MKKEFIKNFFLRLIYKRFVDYKTLKRIQNFKNAGIEVYF